MLIEHLQKTLAERCRKNPAYSLRAFAQSLQLDSSTLSALLRGKRPLTAKSAKKIIDALEIADPALKQQLLVETFAPKSDLVPAYSDLELEAAEMISAWEHFAILAMLEVPTTKGEANMVARKLNLPIGIVLDCLVRLEKLGLVKLNLGRWNLTGNNLATPANIPSAALRETNKNFILKALDSMERDPIETRDITGITMAIDSSKLKEAQKDIQDFRRKLSKYLETGKKDSVYRLNIQLFPLAHPESKQ